MSTQAGDVISKPKAYNYSEVNTLCANWLFLSYHSMLASIFMLHRRQRKYLTLPLADNA
jgi:hypothetical protein